MSGTVSLQWGVLQKLDEDLSTLGVLDGVQVSLGRPASDNVATEHVWILGTTPAEYAHNEMSGGQTRVSRDQRFTVEIQVSVRSKKLVRDNISRAFELAGYVELYIAGNPRLDGLTGLNWCIMDGLDADLGRLERQPSATIDITLSCSGRLR